MKLFNKKTLRSNMNFLLERKKKFAEQIGFFAFFFLIFSSDSVATCVIPHFTVLRGGPSQDHYQAGVARQYRPFEVLKSKGEWVKVRDSRHFTYWIQEAVISNEIECAIVTSRTANTRIGPGTNYRKDPEIPKVNRYFTAKVLKEKVDWVKLENTDGHSFWIFKDLLWIN